MVMSKQYAKIVLGLFTLSAILYNSWPLGYWLDSSTAHYGLASDLESQGHPYYWLFVLGDILVGLILLSVVLLIYWKSKSRLWNRSVLMVYIGLLCFGLLTATSAAAPINCNPSTINLCANINNHRLGPDGLESTIAEIGLFISLTGVILINIKYQLSKSLRYLTIGLLVLLPISGGWFLDAAADNSGIHVAQQVLLIVTGIIIFVIGINMYVALSTPQSRINRLNLRRIHRRTAA